MLGTYLNGGAIGRFRFDEPTLRSQDDSEIVVRVGVIRIECDGALTGGNRLVQVEPIPEDDPQITVPVGAIGCELETAFDQRESLIAAPSWWASTPE